MPRSGTAISSPYGVTRFCRGMGQSSLMVTSAVFDADAAASQVVTALLPQADSERAGQAKRYLKSDLDFLGVSVPAIRSAVRDVARTRNELDRDGALAWARALWREPVHERRTAAIEVLRWYSRPGQPAPPGLRAPCRALRVHPGRDDHRGADAGEPPGHRAVARAQPGRDERPGGGIWA